MRRGLTILANLVIAVVIGIGAWWILHRTPQRWYWLVVAVLAVVSVVLIVFTNQANLKQTRKLDWLRLFDTTESLPQAPEPSACEIAASGPGDEHFRASGQSQDDGTVQTWQAR